MNQNSMNNAGTPGEKKSRFPAKEAEMAFFRPPDGYFDNLEEQIMDRVSENAPGSGRMIPLRRQRILFAAAALLLIFIGVGTVISWYRSSPVETPAYDLADADIIDYLLATDPSGTIVMELADFEENLEEVPGSLISDQDISDEDILEYLYNSGINENELYNL